MRHFLFVYCCGKLKTQKKKPSRNNRDHIIIHHSFNHTADRPRRTHLPCQTKQPKGMALLARKKRGWGAANDAGAGETMQTLQMQFRTGGAGPSSRVEDPHGPSQTSGSDERKAGGERRPKRPRVAGVVDFQETGGEPAFVHQACGIEGGTRGNDCRDDCNDVQDMAIDCGTGDGTGAWVDRGRGPTTAAASRLLAKDQSEVDPAEADDCSCVALRFLGSDRGASGSDLRNSRESPRVRRRHRLDWGGQAAGQAAGKGGGGGGGEESSGSVITLSCRDLRDRACRSWVYSARRQIRSLVVQPCVHVSDEMICATLPFLPVLASLSLRGCVSVTAASLRHVAYACPSLAAIDVRSCPRLSAASVAHFLYVTGRINDPDFEARFDDVELE